MSMDNRKLFVSRQSYWGEENPLCVEIAIGGLDYANPDMLVAKYSGEGDEFTDPREAAKTAIDIATQWRKDCGKTAEEITVRWGCTGGCTMPFDESTDEEVTAWADDRYEKMPKCDRCGDPLPSERHQYRLTDYDTDARFCSENCANMAFEAYQTDIELDLSQVDDDE